MKVMCGDWVETPFCSDQVNDEGGYTVQSITGKFENPSRYNGCLNEDQVGNYFVMKD